MSLRISASDHPIKSVTIFKSDTAEVTRTFALNLEAGRNKIEIIGLPSVIDREAIRVSGLGDARLFDVACNIVPQKVTPSEQLKQLGATKLILERHQNVRQHESEMLVKYGRSMSGEFVAPDQMQSFLESFLDISAKNIAATSEINHKIEDIGQSIDEELSKESIRKGSRTAIVTMFVKAETTGPVELKLTYLVTHASWVPTYEIHATTHQGKPTPQVKLHYRARIRQSTGEDWDDATISLSTMNSGVSNSQKVPLILPVYVKPQGSKSKSFTARLNSNNNNNSLFVPQPLGQTNAQSQQVIPTIQQTGGLFGSSGFQSQPQGAVFGSSVYRSQPQQGALFGSSGVQSQTQQSELPAVEALPLGDDDEYEQLESVPVSKLSEPSMVVSETPLAISYSVEEAVSIPSDDEFHQASIAVLPFEAKIDYILVPRVEPKVYLECSVKNTSKMRLLRGALTVILDDGHVSKTTLGETSIDSTFDFTLGEDPSLRVTYSRKQKVEKLSTGAFSEQWDLTTYITSITVQNLHEYEVDPIIIRDGVPVPCDTRAKVVLKKPSQLVEGKNSSIKITDQEKGGKDCRIMWLGEKKGTFQWCTGIESSGKIELEEIWEVKIPADEVWVMHDTRLGGFAFNKS